MDAICAELDEVFVKYFELYQQLQSVRKQLANHCDQGRYRISDARFELDSLPAACELGPASYQNRAMNATLHLRPNDNGEWQPKETIPAATSGPTGRSSVFATSTTATVTPSSSGTTTEAGEDPQAKKKPIATQPLDLSTRPLQWFGALTPQPLYESQREFRAAIDDACTIANLTKQLTRYETQYDTLLKRKQELSSASTSSASSMAASTTTTATAATT